MNWEDYYLWIWLSQCWGTGLCLGQWFKIAERVFSWFEALTLPILLDLFRNFSRTLRGLLELASGR